MKKFMKKLLNWISIFLGFCALAIYAVFSGRTGQLSLWSLWPVLIMLIVGIGVLWERFKR